MLRRVVVLLALLTASAETSTAQWQLQDAHTTADLRGIDNVGEGVAWASGSQGTILRTEDAGFVWQLCAKPPGGEHLDFRAIQAFDNNTAIVMSSGKGVLSRLYKTTDGCQTWKLLFTNPDKDGFWDALRIQPDQWGYLLGDPVNGMFALFETWDGGRTWTRQHNKGLRAQSSEQGAFAASNSSMSADSGFVLFGSGGKGGAFTYSLVRHPDGKTDFDGRRAMWDREPVPIGNHSGSSGVFAADGYSIAVGGDYKSPDNSSATAAVSFDTGRTWMASKTMPHGYRSAVAYNSNTKTWITVGPNGTDISTDDGRNWRALKPDAKFNDTPDADQHWNALSLPYAVGPHGRIGTLRPSALRPTQ